MPSIVREEVDNLNAVLKVTITYDDLQPKIDSELKRFRQKAQLKGFRKGKTPLGFIKKLYGTQIKADVVNRMLEKELNTYLEIEKPNIFGQPLPSDTQEDLDLNINNKDDLVFVFDLGLIPDFEVKGLDKTETLSKHKVVISDEVAQKELESVRKRMSTRVSVNDSIREGDMIYINADEMDGDAIKLDGWASTFSILYNDIEDEAVKEALKGESVGTTFTFNVRTIEGERDEEFIRKHLLNVGEADEGVEIGDYFQGTVSEITRLQPAELDEEFFNKYFGEAAGITSEAAALEKIKESITKSYTDASNALLDHDIYNHLLEENELAFPNAFLKRWMLKNNENTTVEKVEAAFPNFKKGLVWTLVRQKLAERYQIEITSDDIKTKVREQILSYFGGSIDLSTSPYIYQIVDQTMQNEKQVQETYDKLFSERVLAAAREDFIIEEQPIEKDAFDKHLEEFQSTQKDLAGSDEEE